MVAFKLGDETFAVAIDRVREIVRVQGITKVPKLPDFLSGVMNLRGQIISVLDLNLRLGLRNEAQIGPESRIIIAEIGTTLVGMIADNVQDVIRVHETNISPPPESVAGNLETGFLEGICRQEDKLIMLLDLDHILSLEELEQLEDVAEADVAPEVD